ncbi:flagellar protein FliO/FliZ [Azospirillaceae bacterium]
MSGGEPGFGVENILRFVGALLFVLSLIGLSGWGLRLLGWGSGGRIRPRRLAVVESVAIDARRRLILARRDNIEYLLLIGGAQDLVVESRIQGAEDEVTPSNVYSSPSSALIRG